MAQCLIPGLPDDIALDCLARVPHRFLPSLRPVCRRWRSTVATASFCCHRERIGVAEDLIFMVQAQITIEQTENLCSITTDGEAKEQAKSVAPPAYTLAVYNSSLDSWHRIVMSAAPVPMFAQCAVGGGSQIVLAGGWDPDTFNPIAEVRLIDLATGTWRRGSAMATARSFFACAGAGGRVYVAGGHDGLKNALRSAEVYDFESDGWTALQDMEDERDECRGVVAGGKFWAVSGYGTERQGQFDTTVEVYDAEVGAWSKDEGIVGDGVNGATASSAAFFAVVREGEERVWCVDCGRREVREYEVKGWRTVAAVPERLRSSVSAAVMGGGERVMVMGADEEGGHGAWVLEVGTKKWERVEMPAGFGGFVYSATALRL